MIRRPPRSTLFPYPPLFGSLELTALLGFQRQRGRGAGQQAAHADGLAGLVAVAVVACVDACNGLLDLLEQLAFAVARSQDRKSTRLNSSHLVISYAVFCLKK